MSRAAFRQSDIKRIIRAARKQNAIVQVDLKAYVLTILPRHDVVAPTFEPQYAPDGKENWDDWLSRVATQSTLCNPRNNSFTARSAMHSFSVRPTNELMMIANAGGGFTLDAAVRPTNDLMMIASAAKSGGGQVIFRGLNVRPTNDLMMIASAGKGHVHFVGE